MGHAFCHVTLIDYYHHPHKIKNEGGARPVDFRPRRESLLILYDSNSIMFLTAHCWLSLPVSAGITIWE